ncbi:MAG: PKD domain-containing protein, partial [Bacteroidetes bacterium]|nr:PKD domain-containing protein [Bacteroidota bacterium]
MKNFLKHSKTLLSVLVLLLTAGGLHAQDLKFDFSASGAAGADKYEGCAPYIITFKASYNGSKSVSKVEIIGTNITVGPNDWDQTSPEYTKTFSLTANHYNPSFRVTFTDNTFQDVALNKVIKVYSKPKPDFVIDGNKDQCLESNKFCFLNESIEGEDVVTNTKHNIVSCTWDFGDGGGSKVCEPCYSYKQGGRQFDVVLTVVDEKGCLDTAKRTKYPNVYEEIGSKFRVRVNNSTGAGCPIADVTFFNQTKIKTSLLDKWVWDWGTGKKHIDTFFKDVPGHFPDMWTDFDRKFSKDGWISPKLIVFTKDGCRDSFILKDAFQVVNYKMDFTWTPDTPCFQDNNISFRMKPRPNATAFLWCFGDPASMILNFNDEDWDPGHRFVGGPGWYNVTLSVLEDPCPVRDTTICFIKLKGPGVTITLPNPPFPAHSCVDPVEIPIEDFERLKYDKCYRDSYNPMETQYVGIDPSSTPGNEVDILPGKIRWVTVEEADIKLDSMFVYCNADTLRDGNGNVVFIVDTAMNPGIDNANGNAIIQARDTSGVDAVGCHDYHEYDSRLFRIKIDNKGSGYNPGVHGVTFSDKNFSTEDGKAYAEVDGNGEIVKVYWRGSWKERGNFYNQYDTAYMTFDNPTSAGGNGDAIVWAIAEDNQYVYDTIFPLEDPIPGVNGEWRYTADQKWVQSFQPEWDYQDPIPVAKSLKIKDFVIPKGGGSPVEKTFFVFHPFMRTHTVKIGGSDYIYTPPKRYSIDYIDDNDQVQTYYPPMYRGTSPNNLFAVDQCTDNFQTMHDTDLINCTGPNLVTFTSHASKYRLMGRSGTQLPIHNMYSTTNMSRAFLGDQDRLIDSCAWNTNAPWGTDSVTYFWDFGDGDACSMVMINGSVVAIDASGVLPNQDPVLCQYSTMAAPKHLFVDDDCYSANLTVYDPKTDCEARSSVNIVNRGPDAGPEDPVGPLTVFDVNSYNQGALLNADGDLIRKGAQVGRTDAPCAANDFNRYAQRIDVSETEPVCGKSNYWMVFDAENDCTVEDCITEAGGKLFNVRILETGTLYKDGTYDVIFKSPKTGSGAPVSGSGKAIIGRFGLDRVIIEDGGSNWTANDTAIMLFADPNAVGGDGAMKVIALSTKSNFYYKGRIQEVEIKGRGAFYNPGQYDVFFPYPGVKDSAYGVITIDPTGFISDITMTHMGSGYPNITDTFWMEFANPAAAGGNCKARVAALSVERNSYRSCPWIPQLVIEMILQNQWSYRTPGWKDIGMIVKVGDCFDTFFYENYKYIIDANADFNLTPNPMTYRFDNADQKWVHRNDETNRWFARDIAVEPWNLPGIDDTTQLPTRMPFDVTFSVKEPYRNDPDKFTNDSIMRFYHFIQYIGTPCGEVVLEDLKTVYNSKFRTAPKDGSQGDTTLGYRKDTIFGQCAGKDVYGDTVLVNMYDTATFTFKKPGKYSYVSLARSEYRSKDGASAACSGGSTRELWFGQFQCFTISDQVVCGDQEVEFRDSVFYWDPQIVCDLGGDFNNSTCINRTGFFYSPDSNFVRRNAYRQNPGTYTGPLFREAIAWDFNSPRFRTDDKGDTIFVNGQPARMQEWQRKIDSTDIDLWVDMDTVVSLFGRQLYPGIGFGKGDTSIAATVDLLTIKQHRKEREFNTA